MTDIQSNLEIETAARSYKIRVMIVDDSVVARSVFARILGGQPEIELVFNASNSEDALKFLGSNSVDLILLDIELPGRSGLDALPDLIRANNNARILIVSSLAERNGPAAVKALSLGACDTLAKPGRTGYSGDFSRQLKEKVIRLGRRKERLSEPKTISVSKKSAEGLAEPPDCIAIGASTGGIPAIYKILEGLEDNVDCPIFITQHLPAAFMAFFAKQLSHVSGRNVQIARVGDAVTRNSIYLAPGDSHLCVTKRAGKPIFADVEQRARSRYCPSVDIMLTSLFAAYGKGVLAIILSGMGNDGARAAKRIDARGGKVIVQDIDSSVVWGMPGAIAKSGAASAILSPDEIAKTLNGFAANKK